MTADRLLAHYERIADAPDAVPRLRRFVLDLAVRGKLVEQDPNDEPASKLLKRIAEEKARWVKAGVIRKPKSFEITTDSPYELPTNWDFVPLGEIIIKHLGGGTPSKNNSDYWNGAVPWASVKDVGKSKYLDKTIDRITEAGLENSSSNLIEPGNLLVVTRMGLGKVSINQVSVAINQDLRALILSDMISIDYAYNYFLTYGFEGTGLTVKGIKLEELLSILFPLPPLAEQHRIVAKVDELMALCDRLDAARAEREATRDRLTASSLVRLDAPDPDPMVFRNHAAFALEHLTPLTTRRDQIKALRQTILNLAVRGKLMAQDPNDEPASELLDKIEAKRKKLYAAKLIPKPKTLPLLEDMANLFLLPEGWMWSMLGELCYQVADGPHFSPQYVPAGEGVPFLSTRNVRSDGFDLASVKHVSRKDHEEFCKRIRPERDDIIYTKGGTTGIAKLNDLDMEFSVWVHLAVLRIDKEWLLPGYLEMALNSPHCYEQSQQYTQGISNFDLGLTRMIKITVPLPPLAEQHRIVAKVDELVALCDRLEASLTTADDTRCRLLGALLIKALEPGRSHVSEQAERAAAHG